MAQKLPILFDPRCQLQLQDFGIEIPLLDTRAEDILRSLQELGYRTWDLGLEHWPMVTKNDLLRVHDANYVKNLTTKNPTALHHSLMQAYELMDEHGKYHRYQPQRAKRPLIELWPTLLRQAQGTLKALQLAKGQTQWSYFLGGGMHHAQTHGGHGFCVIHDGAVALKKMLATREIKRAWIIDVDAHKGDGTAQIFKNDPRVLTLSIHMDAGWPLGNYIFPKGLENVPSRVDVEVRSGEESEYSQLLQRGLEHLRRRSQELWGHASPCVAWIVDGSDPFEEDVLPSTQLLQLTQQQMLERNMLLAAYLYDCKVPQAYCLAGGYGPSVYKIHLQTILFLAQLFSNSHSQK